MSFLDLFKQRRPAVVDSRSLRTKVMRLRRVHGPAFRRAWREVGVDIEAELRLMGMLWRRRDVGSCYTGTGEILYPTNLLGMQCEALYRRRFPFSPLEKACYDLRWEVTLRRMAPQMAGETLRRRTLLRQAPPARNWLEWRLPLRPYQPYGWPQVPQLRA